MCSLKDDINIFFKKMILIFVVFLKYVVELSIFFRCFYLLIYLILNLIDYIYLEGR